MPPIRVVFAALPPMLRDLLRDALAEWTDARIVGESDRPEEVAEAVGRGAELLVAEERPTGIPCTYLRLMHRDPRLRLVTVTPDGRRAALYRLEARVLGDLPPRELVEAMRRSGAGEA